MQGHRIAFSASSIPVQRLSSDARRYRCSAPLQISLVMWQSAYQRTSSGQAGNQQAVQPDYGRCEEYPYAVLLLTPTIITIAYIIHAEDWRTIWTMSSVWCKSSEGTVRMLADDSIRSTFTNDAYIRSYYGNSTTLKSHRRLLLTLVLSFTVCVRFTYKLVRSNGLISP